MIPQFLRYLVRYREAVLGLVLILALLAGTKSVAAGLVILAVFAVLVWLLASASAARGYPLSKLLQEIRDEQAHARQAVEVHEFLERISVVLFEGLRAQSRHDIQLIDRRLVGGEVGFLLDFGVNGWDDIDRAKLLRHIRAVFPGRFSAIDFIDPGREDNTAVLVLKGKRIDHTATAQTAAW